MHVTVTWAQTRGVLSYCTDPKEFAHFTLVAEPVVLPQATLFILYRIATDIHSLCSVHYLTSTDCSSCYQALAERERVYKIHGNTATKVCLSEEFISEFIKLRRQTGDNKHVLSRRRDRSQ